VLTGYLITLSLVNSLIKTNTPQLRRYFSRRLRNIMPSLFILFFMVQIYEYYAGDENFLITVEHHGVAALFQVANWTSISASAGDYWESFGRINPFGQMWSLSVTEQFFLLIPFLLWVIWKICKRENLAKTFRRMTICMGALWFASTVVMPTLWNSGASWKRVYMGTDARLHEYLLGTLAALILLWQHRSPSAPVRYFSERSIRVKKLLLALITTSCGLLWALMIFCNADYQSEALYNGGFVFISIILTILALSLSHPENPFVKFFAHNFPIALGAYSYEIYVFHLFIAMLIKNLTPDVDPLTLFATTLVLSSLFSAVMYHAVTHRFRVRKFNSERVIPVVASLLGLSIAFSMWLPYVEESRLSYLMTHEKNASEVQNDGNKILEQKTPSEVANFNALIIGDSVAVQYENMLSKYNKTHSANIKYTPKAIPGCGLLDATQITTTGGHKWNFDNKNRENCSKWRGNLEKTVNNEKVDIVMIDDDIDVNDVAFSDGTNVGPCAIEYKEQYTQILDFINNKVSPTNTKVAISGVLPYTGTHKDKSYANCYNEIITDYAKSHPHWMVIDNQSILCTPEQIEKGDVYCSPKTHDGQNVFLSDGTHFDVGGISAVGSIYVDLIHEFLKKE
jgi:peptidoglycan/LPS O-acetylase OafA/YrhL